MFFFDVFGPNQGYKALEPISETTVSDQIHLLEQQYRFQAADTNGVSYPLELRLDIFETPATAFLFSFVGDSATMQAEASAVDTMLASARLNIQPAPPVQVTLDNLTFAAPAVWDASTISDPNNPSTWGGTPPSDTMKQVIPLLQARVDPFASAGFPVRIIWGAQVMSMHKPVIVALARFETSTSPDDLGAALDVLKQQAGVQPTSDDTVALNGSVTDVLRTMKFDFNQAQETDWDDGLYIHGQAYLVWIIGDSVTMKGYSATLTNWLESFAAAS